MVLFFRCNEHARNTIGNKPDTPMGDHFGNVRPDAMDVPPCMHDFFFIVCVNYKMCIVCKLTFL